MQNWTEILEAWRAIPAVPIKRTTIQTDPALQPRNPKAVAFKHQSAVETESRNHVESLTDRLRVVSDLDPILVAEIDGSQYVVDGHHRLKAYKAMKKGIIPARVSQTNWDTAIAVSKLVNLDFRALRMHREQAREACWQYFALITQKGQVSHTKITSCAKAAALFGCSADTVHRMIKALPGIDLRNFTEAAFDPGTGWPLWRHCKGHAEPFADVSEQLRAERQAERIAKQLGKVDSEINTLALSLLIREFSTDSGELPPPLPELLAHYSREAIRSIN